MTTLLVIAGMLGMAVACYHGYLGETKLIAPATFPNRQGRLLVSAVWQLSTVVWIVSGAVISASPWLFSDHSRPWAVAAACLPLLYGAVANAVITRGRHFGWKALSVVISLAAVGVLL
jgi:hypothetical protein